MPGKSLALDGGARVFFERERLTQNAPKLPSETRTKQVDRFKKIKKYVMMKRSIHI
jgi:hypothetical protein